MPFRRPSRPHLMLAAGLIGMSLYQVAVHHQVPVVVANDFVQGTWLGACIGLELLALIFLKRGRSRCSA